MAAILPGAKAGTGTSPIGIVVRDPFKVYAVPAVLGLALDEIVQPANADYALTA